MLAAVGLAILAVTSPVRAVALGQDDDDDPKWPVTEITVTSKRLDAARANVDLALGASTYTLSNDAVEARPFGETTSINQTLLQLPGVIQDGSGQLHVRQSHGDLQYRINNVILPEGLSDLGASLSSRLASKVQLVTGALPAQYGFQAGGVVSVTTKNGAYLDGGQVELYGGGFGEIEPAFEYGGSIGDNNLFVSGSFQGNEAGLAPPDPGVSPLHDRTHEVNGFAYLDRVLNPETRASLILGLSNERFQLPNVRGLHSSSYISPKAMFTMPLTLAGVADVSSEALDSHRLETTSYAIATLLHADEKRTVQGSIFVRSSRHDEIRDGVGELLFTGLARSDRASQDDYGVQIEAVLEAAAAHTVRTGLVLSSERRRSDMTDTVLAVDAAGRQTSTVAFTVRDTERVTVRKQSLFVQDEWRATDALTINFGARLDDVSGHGGGTALSPRLNAVWTPPGGVVFHLGYARYFLPALSSETGPLAALRATTGAAPGVASTPLQAERDDYWDIGMRADPLPGLTFGIDAYWRSARNYIAEGQFGPAGVPVTFNQANARLRGVEFSANYTLGRWTAWANLSLAEARGRGIASAQAFFSATELAASALAWRPMAFDQRVTASGGASYRMGPLRVSGDFTAGSGLPRSPFSAATNAGHLRPYGVVNLAGVYHLVLTERRSLDLRLDVGNLFDHAYRLRDGTGFGDGPPQLGMRRAIYCGAEYTF